MPAHNAAAFIGEALDSVDAQTLDDHEIVVVDDGSTDATAAVVGGWRARHPRRALTLERQPNRGIGGARNTGVRIASGEFLAFLDADDLWLPEKLGAVTRFLAAEPATDLVCHDEWLVDAAGGRRPLRHGPFSRYEDLLFRGNPVSTSATVVRRDAVLKAGVFSEDLRYNGAEDYDLWLRLAAAGYRLRYLHEILGVYRVHGSGITAQAEEHGRNTLNVLAAHFAAFRRPTLRQRYRYHRRRAAILRGAIHTLIAQGDGARARRLVREAAREDPLAWKTWALGVLSVRRG